MIREEDIQSRLEAAKNEIRGLLGYISKPEGHIYYIDEFGFDDNDRLDARLEGYGDDVAAYYLDHPCDIGFYFGKRLFWIENECEDYRGLLGYYVLAESNSLDPDWGGQWLHRYYEDPDSRDTLFKMKTDPWTFLDNAKLEGIPIRRVIENSCIIQLG